MQCVPRGSGPKKKKVQVILQQVIKEVNEEVAVEELTGKEAMPEEAMVEVAAPVKVTALEEVPVVNALPCLEELIWVTLQEVRKMHKSAERCEHFEFGIWEELRKFVTLKGREVSMVQGNVMPAGVAQESATVGKSCYESSLSYPARRLGLVGFRM